MPIIKNKINSQYRNTFFEYLARNAADDGLSGIAKGAGLSIVSTTEEILRSTRSIDFNEKLH